MRSHSLKQMAGWRWNIIILHYPSLHHTLHITQHSHPLFTQFHPASEQTPFFCNFHGTQGSLACQIHTTPVYVDTVFTIIHPVFIHGPVFCIYTLSCSVFIFTTTVFCMLCIHRTPVFRIHTLFVLCIHTTPVLTNYCICVLYSHIICFLFSHKISFLYNVICIYTAPMFFIPKTSLFCSPVFCFHTTPLFSYSFTITRLVFTQHLCSLITQHLSSVNNTCILYSHTALCCVTKHFPYYKLTNCTALP
jgi:hypothetical protein